MIQNNPYYYHPQPHLREAADAVLSYIEASECAAPLFEQGKMLGVLLLDADSVDKRTNLARVHYINDIPYLAAYSGVINGYTDEAAYFVPPIYDLQQPDEFYLQKDAEITMINQQIKAMEQGANENTHCLTQKGTLTTEMLKKQRTQLSIALQKEIFSHFNLLNPAGQYRNIIDIFADAKRGLPPGGSGECAAPRLLQYAYLHGLRPMVMGEFWYGVSPKKQLRIHGHFYPSCIEKCSPLLRYMEAVGEGAPLPNTDPGTSLDIKILYEDDYLLVLDKPSGLLSVPAKDLTQSNVENLLHILYSDVKGPMLVHRLDQATSGIMLAAKDAATHKALQQQFEEKTIRKHYLAQVRGIVLSLCGIINLPLCVNPDDRPRQVVSPQYGKSAVTVYEVIRVIEGTTWLRLTPLTGRTHQLRVHCASPFGLDHAILGDTLYDILDPSAKEKSALRLMLHAEQITFVHPVSGETRSYSTKI